jgi:hypothetical protein
VRKEDLGCGFISNHGRALNYTESAWADSSCLGIRISLGIWVLGYFVILRGLGCRGTGVSLLPSACEASPRSNPNGIAYQSPGLFPRSEATLGAWFRTPPTRTGVANPSNQLHKRDRRHVTYLRLSTLRLTLKFHHGFSKCLTNLAHDF